MILRIEAISDTGLVREKNEDMVLVQGELVRNSRISFEIDHSGARKSIFAVADGMGGYNGGEYASEIVLQELDDLILSLEDGLTSGQIITILKEWLNVVHDNICQKGIAWKGFTGMGTTLVAMIFYYDITLIINIGDSRAYRFRDNVLRQLTIDHSLKELDHKRIIPSNIIYNAIGGRTDKIFMDIEDISGSLFDKDQFILCSDGLSEMLDNDTLENILRTENDINKLFKRAIAAGGLDNISIINLYISKK